MNTTPVTLTDIQTAAKKFADARARLGTAVTALNSQLEALKRQMMPHIKEQLANTASRMCELQHLIETNPGLFDKPRTQIFHGIKLGFRKGSGGIDWEDDTKVVELIRKHFTKPQADLLIKTTEKPIAKALADLDVTDLKKIGCTVESTGDVVVIRPVDSEVDKIVNALLKDALEAA